MAQTSEAPSFSDRASANGDGAPVGRPNQRRPAVPRPTGQFGVEETNGLQWEQVMEKPAKHVLNTGETRDPSEVSTILND